MQDKDKQKTRLHVIERVFCACFLFMFFILALVVYRARDEYAREVINREVLVVGAVVQEKKIQLPLGATIGDVISKVSLSKEAAMEKVSLDSLCTKNLFIVPKKKCITIYVTGRCEGVYYFPEGSLMKDLYEKVKIHGKFRKTRKLKDCEVISL